MIIEVSQHGIIVQTLLKVLLLTSSCCSLKKKSACFLPWTFKEDTYEPNQHFNVLWVGLLVSLFLFSLPDQPRGVYTVSPLPPAWLSFTCCFFLGWVVAETLLLVSTVRWEVWGVWRDWRNKNNFFVCLCVQSLPKLSCEHCCLQRSLLKYVFENLPLRGSVSPCVWTLMKWHKGKPCATELNKNIHYS